MAIALSPGEIFKAAGEGSCSAWSSSTSSGRPSPLSVTCGGPARMHGLSDAFTRVTPNTVEPPASFELELVCRSGAAHRRTPSVGVGCSWSVLTGRVQAPVSTRNNSAAKVFHFIVSRVYHQPNPDLEYN